MSEETNVLVVIPQEVTTLAEKVAADKREEVNTILNQLFSGTESWKQQISNIKVKDHTDTMAMQMAGTARLSVKKARLEAEKLFDAKREEVQRVKLEYDLEDKLWLKSKQIMQEMFKSIEQEAEYKENTAKRYEIEQKEIRTQERLQKVVFYNPTVSRFDIENLNDEMFNVFLSGLEKEHNDRIEAEQKAEAERLENERLLKLLSERRFTLAKFGGFYTSTKEITINTTEEEFNTIVLECEKVKKEYEVQQEKQRLENERLKAEAEAKQKEIEERNKRDEKRSSELRPYIIFIRDYNKMISLSDDDYSKEFKDIKKGAEEHWEFERKEQLRVQQEQEKAASEKAKLEKELRDKQEAEERAANEKRIAAEKAQKEADKLAKAPVKKQLDVWVNSFSIQKAPIENEVSKLIEEKFAAFKNWSLEQIEKL